MPTELAELREIRRRLHKRGERPEYRFRYDDRSPRLPVRRDGSLQFVRWGNLRRKSRHLPETAWTWRQEIESGLWRSSGAVLVEIPASAALDGRGVWYHVERGVQGLLVPDERGMAVAYVVCEPASHYYKNMTGSTRMAVLISQRY